MYILRNGLLLVAFGLIALPSFSQATSPAIDQQLVAFFQNQEYAKAAAYLRQMKKEDTLNSHYLSLLGYSYYMSSQFALATRSFSSLLTADSANAIAHYYLGKMQAAKGNIPFALKHFCRLVELKPGVANYYKQLAALWARAGNSAAAGWYYKMAYRVNPGDPEVIANLASNWIKQEMYQDADRIVDLALRNDSLQAHLLVVRIRSAYAQEKYRDIFPLYRQLRKMNFVGLKPFLFTAIGYFELKQYDSCIATCQLLVQNKLETRTTIYLEALSYKALKEYDKALDKLNTCIGMALDDGADNYFTVKAAVLELMHQPSRALKQYDTAYYIFHRPLQLYHKARVYDAKFENYKVALRYYHRYLKNHSKTKRNEEVVAFVKKRVKQLEEWEKQQ